MLGSGTTWVCKCPLAYIYVCILFIAEFAYNTDGCTAASRFQCATPGAVCVATTGATGVCKCPTGTHTYRNGLCVRGKSVTNQKSYEPRREKTDFLHMRKQRRRSALRLPRS